jgi:hypothetical protein
VRCISFIAIILDHPILSEIIQAESSLIAFSSRRNTQAVVIDHGIPENEILPICIGGVITEIEWRTAEMRQLLVIQRLKLTGIRNVDGVGYFLYADVRTKIDIRRSLLRPLGGDDHHAVRPLDSKHGQG